MKLINSIYIILFVFLLSYSNETLAQSPSLIEFGQNRVQYKEFKWQFYETENFRIYYYKGGQDLGKYVILNAEKLFEEMTKSLDFRLQKKIDLLVYNDISDLRQSNIGLKSKQQIENGQVKFIDNKMFIYFNGSHKFFDQQIKEGITNIFINKYVKGAGLRETVKNSVAKNLPEWYLKGLTDYNSIGWNTALENKLKDKILSGKFKNLSKLNADEMAFVGHSVWNYLEEIYGKESVNNLMYLVKVNRSLNRGFRYVTGKDLASFFEEWYYYYLKRFKIERKEFNAFDKDYFLNIKIKKNRVVYESKLHPKGKSIAYVTNEEGKWRIHLYNLKDSTDKIIFKGGFRTNTIKTDLMNPMLAWEKRGNTLSIIYELRDKFFIRDYNVEEDELVEERAIRKFQKIYSFSYAENSKNILLSAMRKGQIDIFKYYLPSTRVTQITNDFYDDLQPSYIDIEDYQGYVFISNRRNDTLAKEKIDSILPNGNFDVFFYDINKTYQKLAQVTKTPLANESYPQAYDDKHFTFLSDNNGINNKYVAHLESKKAYDKIQYTYTNEDDETDSLLLNIDEPLDSTIKFNYSISEVLSQKKIPIFKTYGVSKSISNNNNGISELSTSKRVNKNLDLVLFKNKQRFILTDYSDLSENNEIKKAGYIRKQEAIQKKEKVIKIQEEVFEEIKDTIKKEIVFQSKFDGWKEDTEEGYSQMLIPMNNSAEETSSAFQFKRTRQYFLKFKADDFNLSLDNKLLINSYQKFNPNNPVYNDQGLGGFLKLGIVDLFENHRLHGGLRIPLDGSDLAPKEFYLTYENLTKRLDKEVTYYRNSESSDITNYNGQALLDNGSEVLETNYIHLKLKYSLDELNSARVKFAVKNENTITSSTESITLNAKNVVNNWAIIKMEFVHDHTIQKAENVLNGFRANGYFEFQKEIPTKDSEVFSENLKLPIWNDGFLMVVGADARHYLKVYKKITWANRLAYSTSFGTRKVVYYLGGSDGQLFPGFNQRNSVDETQNYAFQSLAQNMRGLPQNTRNGNSYIVLNSEFRFPVFSTLSKKAMKSKFMESIQLVTFFDVGSAWQGVTPWDSNNLYKEVRTNSPKIPEQATAIVKLQIYKDPFVFAFGQGVRASIFGYFFRFDLGWAYDTGELLKPKMHVSMTYDF